jgi:GNAT superfamily N-acetyltransferase
MNYRLRPGRADDAELLGAVEGAAAARFAEVGLTSIAEGRTTGPAEYRRTAAEGRLWVAEAGEGEVVGLAIAGVVDGGGHLAEISVLPAHGRRGLGAALIREVEAWAVSQGFATLSLTTFRDVPWNRPYYEGLGYEVLLPKRAGPELRAIRAGEVKRGLDNLSPRVCMGKRIA